MLAIAASAVSFIAVAFLRTIAFDPGNGAIGDANLDLLLNLSRLHQDPEDLRAVFVLLLDGDGHAPGGRCRNGLGLLRRRRPGRDADGPGKRFLLCLHRSADRIEQRLAGRPFCPDLQLAGPCRVTSLLGRVSGRTLSVSVLCSGVVHAPV